MFAWFRKQREAEHCATEPADAESATFRLQGCANAVTIADNEVGSTVSLVLWMRPMISRAPIRALPASSSPISAHDGQASRRGHGNAKCRIDAPSFRSMRFGRKTSRPWPRCRGYPAGVGEVGSAVRPAPLVERPSFTARFGPESSALGFVDT
jgi:hypothetical protein